MVLLVWIILYCAMVISPMVTTFGRYLPPEPKLALWFFLLGQGPVEQSSTNKPLAMRVVEDALAYSKKPPVI